MATKKGRQTVSEACMNVVQGGQGGRGRQCLWRDGNALH